MIYCQAKDDSASLTTSRFELQRYPKITPYLRNRVKSTAGAPFGHALSKHQVPHQHMKPLENLQSDEAWSVGGIHPPTFPHILAKSERNIKSYLPRWLLTDLHGSPDSHNSFNSHFP
jgi:hypothetical protein